MRVSVLPLGDAAFTLTFDGWTEIEGAARINALAQNLLDRGDLPGLVDLIPASRSLTVCFDPAAARFEALQAAIVERAQTAGEAAHTAPRAWRFPAGYGGAYGPDLESVAEATGLDADAVIAAHSAQTYRVLLIGFLPGFPFLGPLDARLRLPRRTEPRLRVPAGSVAIANDRTAIYPWESPGGWRLLARCPVPLFDPGRPQPSLLQPGDSVTFTPVEAAEIAELEAALAAGALAAERFLVDGEPA